VRHHHSSAPARPDQAPIEPPADRPVRVRDTLPWSWDDLAALTGLSRRFLEREVSAGGMPPTDVRFGRRARIRPATIMSWLDEQGGRP
jgi:excisionase family DNA binding protein